MAERYKNFLLGVIVVAGVLFVVISARPNQQSNSSFQLEERRFAEVRRMHADARAAMSKAEQTGSRSDFEAAQRAADRVDGALRVFEVADSPKLRNPS